jgi:hypothetical protein
MVAGVQQLQVGVAHRADDELRHDAGAQPLLAPQLADPLQAREELAPEILLGRQRGQPLGGGALQVDRDAVGELHRPPHLVVLGAGHDLEVDVAAIAVAFAQNLGGVDDLVLRRHAALDDPRREEQPLHQSGALDGIIGFRHLVGRVSDACRLAAPGAEGAVEAIALARRRHHRLEHWLLASGRGDVRDARQRFGRARRRFLALRHRLIAGWLEARGVVKQREFLNRVGCCPKIHTSIIRTSVLFVK